MVLLRLVPLQTNERSVAPKTHTRTYFPIQRFEHVGSLSDEFPLGEGMFNWIDKEPCSWLDKTRSAF